ncbi:MAG: hypothetical protein WC254_06980, partial [Candidatus Woesearchaeota archaeon]
MEGATFSGITDFFNKPLPKVEVKKTRGFELDDLSIDDSSEEKVADKDPQILIPADVRTSKQEHVRKITLEEAEEIALG